MPAGEFIMGANENDPLADEDEKPQHKVHLDAFWIDRTEVTNVSFLKCLDAGACRPDVYETTASSFIPYAVHPDYRNFPAFVYASEAAEEYCQWAGRRLPSEAEWEKAARGTDGRLYPWGNSLDCAHANYFGCDKTINTDPTAPRCGYSKTCRTANVEDYPNGASPYGVLNMAGNVWEWVNDWYQADYYSTSPTNNPQGPAFGDYKTLRGGGVKSLSQYLRATSRAIGTPQHFFDSQIGFRCTADGGE